jgi:hypothetical protein
MELPSRIVDREVTLEEYDLIVETANEVDPHAMEQYGEMPLIAERIGYGEKAGHPIDSAKLVIQFADDLHWEDLFWGQSLLLGGEADHTGVEIAVESLSG